MAEKPLLLIAFYGTVPEHIRATFGIGNAGCRYEVVREGERIPDEWEQALIIHHNDGYTALKAADLLVQLKSLNPSGIVFVLPVEVEQRNYTAELKSAIDFASQQYYGSVNKP